MDRQYNDKWGAGNRRNGQTIKWQMRRSKSERRINKTIPSLWFIAPHLSFIVCPSLLFTAPHWSLYCLTIPLIYCSSFVIVLSVHLSDVLLLICYCIVCPSLRFTAPDLLLYCLSFSPIYCSSFAIVLSVDHSDLLPSFVIVLSVHFSDLLHLICHCIVCPSLRFTSPHLSLYCLSISPIYCSSFVIVLSVHPSDLLLLVCH
jgi:hypothetical protein